MVLGQYPLPLTPLLSGISYLGEYLVEKKEINRNSRIDFSLQGLKNISGSKVYPSGMFSESNIDGNVGPGQLNYEKFNTPLQTVVHPSYF